MSIKEFDLGRSLKPLDIFRPNKLVIIGAGALKNSWEPLSRVFLNADNINDVNKYVYKSKDKYKQMAAYLAQLVYTSHANSISLLKLKTDNSIDNNTKTNIEKEIMRLDKNYDNFINAICHEYKNTSLLTTNEFEIVKKELNENTGVIVLNWDETIWNMKESFPNVLQLHGRVSYPGTIILPTELSIEKAFFQKMISKQNIDMKSIDSLDGVHNIAYEWMCSAETIISWGVGYNLYDSELNILIESALYCRSPENRIRNVLNINKDPDNDISISRLMNITKEEIHNYFYGNRLRHPWLRRLF